MNDSQQPSSAAAAYRKRRGGRGVYPRSSSIAEKPGTIQARDYLLPAQVNQILESTAAVRGSGNLARLALLLQWRAGLRISEACSLTWAGVDLELGQLNILGKGSKYRSIPLQAQLRNELEAVKLYRPPGRLVTISTRRVTQCLADAVRDSVGNMPELAEKRIVSHTMRRSACIHWLSSGVPINQVKRWMGHSSIQTTMIYAELIADLPGMMDRVD